MSGWSNCQHIDSFCHLKEGDGDEGVIALLLIEKIMGLDHFSCHNSTLTKLITSIGSSPSLHLLQKLINLVKHFCRWKLLLTEKTFSLVCLSPLHFSSYQHFLRTLPCTILRLLSGYGKDQSKSRFIPINSGAFHPFHAASFFFIITLFSKSVLFLCKKQQCYSVRKCACNYYCQALFTQQLEHYDSMLNLYQTAY